MPITIKPATLKYKNSSGTFQVADCLKGDSGSMNVTTITGTTPSIVAEENGRYVCGEVSTLSFTPCVQGICDIQFQSGSPATVLTVPNTVLFPEWFDASALEINKVYEISIVDGVYAAVGIWAVGV